MPSYQPEVPQVRPTHTPVSAGEVTDTEPQAERSSEMRAERKQYVEPPQVEAAVEAPPERDELLEEQALTGDPAIDLEGLIYQDSRYWLQQRSSYNLS